MKKRESFYFGLQDFNFDGNNKLEEITDKPVYVSDVEMAKINAGILGINGWREGDKFVESSHCWTKDLGYKQFRGSGYTPLRAAINCVDMMIMDLNDLRSELVSKLDPNLMVEIGRDFYYKVTGKK